jgi:hypothetical protein
MNVWKGAIAYIVDTDTPENMNVFLAVIEWDGEDLEWKCELLSAAIGWNHNNVDENGDSIDALDMKPGDIVYCDDEDLRPLLPPPGTVTTEEVKTLFSPSPSMEPA